MSQDQASVGPAATYQHNHPPVRDINQEFQENMSPGERIADRVAAGVGSWPFIIIQSLLLILWMAINVYLGVMAHLHPGFLKAWDPYPFILLNLVLSFQAAYTGPVVMMSQNRQAAKDRLMAQYDYEVNQKAEREINVVLQHLAHEDRLLLEAIQAIEAMQVVPPMQEVAEKVDALLKWTEAQDESVIARAE